MSASTLSGHLTFMSEKSARKRLGSGAPPSSSRVRSAETTGISSGLRAMASRLRSTAMMGDGCIWRLAGRVRSGGKLSERLM